MKFKHGETLTKSMTRNKIIFWDIDGCLAPYRFNGHVCNPNGENGGMSNEEIEAGIFLHRPPSNFMQKVVNSCEAKENIVLSHCWKNEKERKDKEKWIKIHYPMIKKYFIIPMSEPKHDVILNFCAENNINLKHILFIDDDLAILRKAEKCGIPSYHITSFLDWKSNDR